MSAADLPRVMEIAQSLEEAPEWPPAAWAAVLSRHAVPRRIALVAAEPLSGIIAGFAVAILVPPQSELELIAVVTRSRRRGIGRLLIAALASELLAAGMQELFLEVRVSNRAARDFYRALGFAETGRRARYYTDPEEDAVLMSLRLA
jgi:ribosomal-protein-alanine N-acetyltransferase